MRRERGFSSGSRRKEGDTCFIGGRNSVLESLRAGQVKKVFIKPGKKDGRLLALANEAERFGISVIEAEERELDRLTEGVRHQGVAASLKPYHMLIWKRCFRLVEERIPCLFFLMVWKM